LFDLLIASSEVIIDIVNILSVVINSNQFLGKILIRFAIIINNIVMSINACGAKL